MVRQHVARATATLTLAYTLPSDAPALQSFVTYSLLPALPLSGDPHASVGGGTLSLTIPADYPMKQVRIGWSEGPGYPVKRYTILESFISPMTLNAGQTRSLGSAAFVAD